MSNPIEALYRWEWIDGVASVEILERELNNPERAQLLGQQLRGLIDGHNASRIVVNFHRAEYMSSTAFGAVFGFIKRAGETGARVALCGMTPSVRVGADILCLGEYAPIFEDEASALKAIRSERES